MSATTPAVTMASSLVGLLLKIDRMAWSLFASDVFSSRLAKAASAGARPNLDRLLERFARERDSASPRLLKNSRVAKAKYAP